ncbi:MAG: hypothetical protein PHH47_06140 [Gallionella sp.]|nr:hypothetical protein [Gallionella sp.]MDD4946005.1 hypothetical protein [Gallionella sp.]MDD5613089.1 hypothetical protein [Gallionella sp.]
MKNILIQLVFVFLFVANATAAELEIINLQHRRAEELLPVIRPLLDREETASGMNYQLILRASPRHIEDIRRLLGSLDTVQRRLRITVMQDVDSETASRLTELSGSASLGRDARVTLPGQPNAGLNAGGGTVSYTQGQDTLSARVISTRALESDHHTQQLQVLEGNRALVRTGQTVPIPQRQVIQNAWGTQVVETTQYQDVSSGFYVLPRLNGDRVTLEISTQNDRLAPNQNPANGYPVTRTQSTSSTVSGRLGEWIDVGGGVQQGGQDNSAITTRSTSRQNEQRTVLIKVEAAD